MRVALVDDELMISEGWQRWLQAAGHDVTVFTFDDALATGAGGWAGFDRLVTDACDRREPQHRAQARKAAGVDYADGEILLGVNVLQHWKSLEAELPLRPLRIVTTTYAEQDRSEPHKLELLLQAGAHYIIPRSKLCSPELCVQRLREPDDQFRATPLSAEQRRKLDLKDPAEASGDLLDAWRELHSGDDLDRLHLVDGHSKETLAGRGARERRLRNLSEYLARRLLPPDGSETKGAKRMYRLRRITRELFGETPLPPRQGVRSNS